MSISWRVRHIALAGSISLKLNIINYIQSHGHQDGLWLGERISSAVKGSFPR
jgi:hypothetical protein